MTAPDGEEPIDHGEGFLGRWSRRKRQVAAEAQPSAPAPLSPPDTSAIPPDERPRDPETGEPIDEELVARLPSIAELAPGADLSAFMQRGVPEALRRQALRALWETDPAIRDFVSPALDYAYDYNAPGGAPGYGPLSDSDIAQAKEMITRVFSGASSADLQPKQEAPSGAEAEDQAETPVNDPKSTHDMKSDIESQGTAGTVPNAVRLTAAGPKSIQLDDDASRAASGPHEAEMPAELPENAAVDRVQRRASDGPMGSPAASAGRPRRRGGGASPI